LQSKIGVGSSESQEFRIGGGKGSQEKVIRSRRWERLFRMLMSGVLDKDKEIALVWIDERLELLRNMTRTSRRKLVSINEKSSVWVTGVNREHPVVNILLGALAVITGSQQPAGRVRVETSLQPGGLGVVVVAISVSLGDVLQDYSPVALNIDSTGDLSVVNIAGAEVALGSNPVTGVIGRGSLGGSGVVLVVEGLLLGLGDILDEVIS